MDSVGAAKWYPPKAVISKARADPPKISGIRTGKTRERDFMEIAYAGLPC
jgi:hypothetical protein